MAHHKPLCWIVRILTIIGGLNWGLTGLGMLINARLNVVNLIFGSWPVVEAIIYLLVGISAIFMLINLFTDKNCACMKTDMKTDMKM